MLEALAAAVRTVPRFDVTLSRVEWFGDSVVWLAPEPDEPFRSLTAAVWQRFPDTPPFRGVFSDVVPHLTVGNESPLHLMRQAGDAVREQLPIRTRVAAAQLICGSREPNSWRSIAELPLGSLAPRELIIGKDVV